MFFLEQVVLAVTSLGPFLKRPDRTRSVFCFFLRFPLKTVNKDKWDKLKTER